MEIFKSIIGYEKYKISNYGNVINNFDKYMTIQTNKAGYKLVQLSKNNKPKKFYIHRLVALHFIDNVDNKPQVNHKDGDRSNNRIDNLEWNTNSENNKHSYDILNRKRPNIKKVLQFTIDGNYINEYNSTMEAQNITGISRVCISNCCNKYKIRNKYESKTAGGYIWKWVQ